MERAIPLPAQFGSFVVPAAQAISASASFVRVTFKFVGRVTSILDADEGAFSIAAAFSVGNPVNGAITYEHHIGATGPDLARGVYPSAPAASLTVGSSFTESLPFAQSLRGLEMAVQKGAAGHSLNFESDFALVRSPVFPTQVEAAMVISLTHYARGALLTDVSPPHLTLEDFDDTQFLITFFDTASGNVSFLEVELEQFATECARKSNGKEPLSEARREVGNTRKSHNDIPQERRVALRRVQPDRRATLRWHPNGGDRRHGLGRRKEDTRNTMKAVLSGLFSVPSGKMPPRQRNA